jgi:segregation and condensation protein A
MSQIMRQLKGASMLEFTALFDIVNDGIPKLVVCFLAILELAREGLISLTQQGAYSPIYVQLN